MTRSVSKAEQRNFLADASGRCGKAASAVGRCGTWATFVAFGNHTAPGLPATTAFAAPAKATYVLAHLITAQKLARAIGSIMAGRRVDEHGQRVSVPARSTPKTWTAAPVRLGYTGLNGGEWSAERVGSRGSVGRKSCLFEAGIPSREGRGNSELMPQPFVRSHCPANI